MLEHLRQTNEGKEPLNAPGPQIFLKMVLNPTCDLDAFCLGQSEALAPAPHKFTNHLENRGFEFGCAGIHHIDHLRRGIAPSSCSS